MSTLQLSTCRQQYPPGNGEHFADGPVAEGPYHDEWRARRDRDKYDRVLGLAECLPAVRNRLAAQLAGRGLSRERVLACAVRLLDLGRNAAGTRRVRSARAGPR